MRQRSRGRIVLAAVVATCAVGALPGQALAVGDPDPYVFDSHAKRVAGAPASTDAQELKAGSTYRSAIKPGGQLYYQVELDADSNAYVSAVAVPKLGPEAKVGYADGIKVTLQDREGDSCDYNDDAVFGSAQYPRPIAAYASRTIKKGSTSCRTAGPYYVLIERTTKATSAQEEWDLEIRFDTEPGLKAGSGGPTEAPSSWPSATPVPPSGKSGRAQGGTGFNDAAALKGGVWDDRIKPGQTLFYRVPVDWGQQLFATADLGSSPGNGYVGSALTVQLYNPVRAAVTSGDTAYDGKPKSAAPDPVAPVAYENRYSTSDAVNGARMAGDYYLAVTLSPEVANKFGEKEYGLTLRTSIKGTAGSPPAYAGAVPDFSAGGGDGTGNGTMKLVGVTGIGAGAVLVLGLGAWTVGARRRAGAPTAQQQARPQGRPQVQAQGSQPQGPSQASQSQQQYGPPSAW
ncbi:hypothetical protein [Streptomyces sp. NPDC090053]|uniref:hypothetical protein n=1 Tax=Streptomyces sp. NPDC090053 TaxID=3365932 RepID=UPI0038197B92